ncbi:hypothetical protein P7C70_g8590, partial [Phenoliferia sp. Uapishka_3]
MSDFRPSRRHPEPAVHYLMEWYQNHISWAYPTEEEKSEMMRVTDLSKVQIDTWFINRRRRDKDHPQGFRRRRDAEGSEGSQAEDASPRADISPTLSESESRRYALRSPPGQPASPLPSPPIHSASHPPSSGRRTHAYISSNTSETPSIPTPLPSSSNRQLTYSPRSPPSFYPPEAYSSPYVAPASLMAPPSGYPASWPPYSSNPPYYPGSSGSMPYYPSSYEPPQHPVYYEDPVFVGDEATEGGNPYPSFPQGGQHSGGRPERGGHRQGNGNGQPGYF